MNYFKSEGKWYRESDFLGTIFTNEIIDQDEIAELEAAENFAEEMYRRLYA